MSLIKSFSVGNGDMFYIKHFSDNFTIIDCCLPDDTKDDIIFEIKTESKNKNITRFISTHPDDDHIHGLKYFDDNISIVNFYCVNNSATKSDETDDFIHYCSLRDSTKKAYYLYEGCSRKWMNIGDDERGSAGINILWPNTSNEYFIDALDLAANSGNPNNISPIVKYAVNDGVTVLWFGDLENSFMENIKDDVDLPNADIIFAPHHGRKSGQIPTEWLEAIEPKIIVIGEAPSKTLKYYNNYNTITQNSAGDIVFDCGDNVDIYVSNYNYSVNFLSNKNKSNTYGSYIGTLVL